jgi:hypothetical protein
MTMKTTVTCDYCGNDIAYTSNCVDYRMVLQAEPKAYSPGTGAVTMMHIEPPLSRPMHFCGWNCISAWFRARPLT